MTRMSIYLFRIGVELSRFIRQPAPWPDSSFIGVQKLRIRCQCRGLGVLETSFNRQPKTQKPLRWLRPYSDSELLGPSNLFLLETQFLRAPYTAQLLTVRN